MNNWFNAFLMGVIVVLILMLVNITGTAMYRELQHYRSADTSRSGILVRVNAAKISGMGR